MSNIIASFDLVLSDEYNLFYIDVPEGSDLLDVTLDTLFVYKAWCIVELGLPTTKRFLRILMPGAEMPSRGDAYRFITTVNDGGMVWLVFEDHQKRREYLQEKHG